MKALTFYQFLEDICSQYRFQWSSLENKTNQSLHGFLEKTTFSPVFTVPCKKNGRKTKKNPARCSNIYFRYAWIVNILVLGSVGKIIWRAVQCKTSVWMFVWFKLVWPTCDFERSEKSVEPTALSSDLPRGWNNTKTRRSERAISALCDITNLPQHHLFLSHKLSVSCVNWIYCMHCRLRHHLTRPPSCSAIVKLWPGGGSIAGTQR